MTTHRLKTWPRYFAAVYEGRKTYEVRRDDRGFNVGDILHLVEWSIHGGETGREVKHTITYISRQSSLIPLPAGYVIMALGPA